MGLEVTGSLLLKSCVDLLCGVLEHKSGQCPTAVESILPGPIGKALAKRAQQLQASGTDGSPDEDPGETGPRPPVVDVLHTSLPDLEKG